MGYKYTKAVYRNNGEYGGQEYNFISLDNDVKVDDLAVVETRNGHAVVKVTGFTNSSDVDVHKHVVQRVDLEAFEKKRDIAKQQEAVLQSMEERIAEISYIKRLEKYAESDDELSELLGEYKALKSLS